MDRPVLDFSAGQRKAIATAITVLSLTVVVAFVAAIAWAALRCLAAVSSAVVPVAFGFFLSLFFKPYYGWIRSWAHNPTLSLVILLVSVFVPVGILLWYAGAVLIDQVSNLIHQGPQLLHNVLDWFRATFPRLNALLTELGMNYDGVGSLYSEYGEKALVAGSRALKCLSGVVTALMTLIFFTFFITTKERRGSEIVAGLPILKPETRDFVAIQIDSFVGILVSFFQRQTIICLIEGVMYGAGFALVGLPYGFLIGFALGVLNLIPFFGSVVCLPLALPLAYFVHGGSASRLVMVLAVWLAGQMLDGYLITPRIQGDKTGLGYAGVIFSFIFWAAVLGPMLGMLLAIPLSAFCVVLWRALKARYLRPLV